MPILKLFQGLLFTSFMANAGNHNIGADMDSEVLRLSNPGCVITEASPTSVLPVLEPNITPSSNDTFSIKIETMKGFAPYITLNSAVTVTGLEDFNSAPDEVTLNELKASGEQVVNSTQRILESTNAHQTDFSSQLFFRLKRSKNNYPARLIDVGATVTFECIQSSSS